jgi:hypothetical protein
VLTAKPAGIGGFFHLSRTMRRILLDYPLQQGEP